MALEQTVHSIRMQASPAAPSRVVRSALLIFLLALTASLVMVFIGFRTQRMVDATFDPYYFGEMGKSLARGEGFEPYGVLIQRRAPLYPLLIGGIYSAFGEQPTLVLLAQALLLAGTSVLAFDIGRRLFNQRTGWIAAGFCALNPLLLRYVGDLQLETLLTFLFTLTIWGTVRFYARPTVLWGAFVGASAGLASLTKAVVFPYLFVFVVVILGLALLRDRRLSTWRRLPWRALVAMLAALAVVIAPWTIRNYVATGGRLVLISSGASDAFLRGYIFSRPEFALLRQPPYTDAENESNALFERLSVAAGTHWQRDDYETDQLLNRAAVEKLRAEPAEFVRKFVTGLFTFWYQMTNLANSMLAGGLAVSAWVLAAAGFRRARREGKPIWLVLAPALYLNVFLAALLALGRYSAPVMPALLVASAFGVDTLLSRLRIDRGRASDR